MPKLVCLVYLVDLVHLVSLVQPNKRDKPNNGLLMRAGFFSILLYVLVQIDTKKHSDEAEKIDFDFEA